MSPAAVATLVLGPMLRYVDTETATIWVQTSAPCRVSVVAGSSTSSGHTFAVHGHHYALVDVTGLSPGSVTPYTVALDDDRVWPPPEFGMPAPTIRTLDDATPLRLLWGSCRKAAGDDETAIAAHGVDALASYALELAAAQPSGDGSDSTELPASAEVTASTVAWPSQLMLIGDQIYADDPSAPMREFIESRRDATAPPGYELADFAEYAQTYRLAWSQPAIAWLLSCVPSMMIFDDHDIRDDWNTSASWREEIRATPWWHDRIVSGLASYWIYQHAGNLSPQQRSVDAFGKLAARAARSGKDVGPDFDELAAAIDAHDPRADGTGDHPGTGADRYSFSYTRRLTPVTLLMLDSRCGRILEPGSRDIYDEAAWRQLERHIADGAADPRLRHFVLASSLPVLLPPTLHYAEQWNEAVCEGAWGRWFVPTAERLRQAIDLEHWSAFGRSFRRLFSLIGDVATGKHGAPPASIQLFGGDVHFSYLMRATLRHTTPRGGGRGSTTGSVSPIYQLVCSPTRNPIARWMKYANFLAAWQWSTGLARLVARTAGVRGPALRWRRGRGLWFDNAVALSEFDGDRSSVRWLTPNLADPRRTRTLGDAELS